MIATTKPNTVVNNATLIPTATIAGEISPADGGIIGVIE